MATIVKRLGKDGQLSFRVQVRRKGAPPLSATFSKLTDARKWVQITAAAIFQGRHFKTAAYKRHTLADLIERYMRDVLSQKSASSIRKQTQQLLWWRARLGHCILADVTPALIAEQRDMLTHGSGIPRANATVNLYLAALAHTFTIAVKEYGWLDNSPMRKVSKPRKPRGRVRYLSDDERQCLLDACTVSRNSSLYTVVVLALSTGARKMEILSLRWGDVDLQRQIITLHETKNGERRVLPLTGHALELISIHVKNRRTETALVFPRSTGTQPMCIREAWEYAVKRADIPDFPIT